jgi:hypothetical protein
MDGGKGGGVRERGLTAEVTIVQEGDLGHFDDADDAGAGSGC